MDLELKDKRVLVTGASRGIGRAIAIGFAQEGCKVSIVARNEENCKKLIDDLGGESAGHDCLISDLRETGEPTKIASQLLEKHKGINIVVHNVGGALGLKDPLGKVEDFNEVWRFNVGIAIEMNAVLIPEMKKQNWGRVVCISSISAEAGEPTVDTFGGSVSYASAKAYLNTYIKGLAKEVAKDNVVVSGVMPGAVLSEGKYWDKMKKENPKLVDDFISQNYPIGRFANADEIVPFVLLLASEKASFAAGSIIPISGGNV